MAERRLPLSLGSQNPVARCIICCFKCCLWCLEKFIKFLNRNAYIMVSMTSRSLLLSTPLFSTPLPA